MPIGGGCEKKGEGGGGGVGEVVGGGGDCWCLYNFIQVRSLKMSRAMRIRYFQIKTAEPHKYCLDKAIKVLEKCTKKPYRTL